MSELVLDGTGAIEDRPLPGIERTRVDRWLDGSIVEATGPFRYELIAGGHSNLTYGVDDAAGHRYVLRRPPLGHVLASAHDMAREHRIMAALAETAVPVPRMRGLCTDADVNGAPFYVMDRVDGVVVRDQSQAIELLSPDTRRTAGFELATVLAALHAVDVAAVGLGDLAKHDGYIARQLKRWYGQWQAQHTSELAAIDTVHDRLMAAIPAQQGTAVVHGDFRLDNTMLDPATGHIVAVLDWEICTLGDALADVGLLAVYYGGLGAGGLAAPPTEVEGFPPIADVIARYGKASGRSLDDIDFYIAFGYWKLACILEGVYARYLGGARGDAGDAASFAGFRVQVERAAAAALDMSEQFA
jgi:aminoglycoside phosphotransferase (APT) family kinase protein